MSSSLNKVMLIGNLTRDPELRKTTSGQSVASFSMATNRVYTDASGQKKDQPEYHNIVVWAKLAEVVVQYCTKGKKIYAEGRIQTREWEKDGVKHYRTEIVADSVIFLDKGGAPVVPQPAGTAIANASTSATAQDDGIPLSDIPF